MFRFSSSKRMSRRKTVRMNNLVPDSKQLMKVKMFLNENCVTKLQKKNIYTIHSLYFQTDAANQEFFVEGKWKAYLKGIVDIQVNSILFIGLQYIVTDYERLCTEVP